MLSQCLTSDGAGLGDPRADVLNEQQPPAGDGGGVLAFLTQGPHSLGERSLAASAAGSLGLHSMSKPMGLKPLQGRSCPATQPKGSRAMAGESEALIYLGQWPLTTGKSLTTLCLILLCKMETKIKSLPILEVSLKGKGIMVTHVLCDCHLLCDPVSLGLRFFIWNAGLEALSSQICCEISKRGQETHRFQEGSV